MHEDYVVGVGSFEGDSHKEMQVDNEVQKSKEK